METKLSTKIQEDTPVFGTTSQISCMQLLEDEFLLEYPLIFRQVEFFESSQQKGQLFSDWTAKLKALGDEASLNSLTTDDIYVMSYLTGTIDEKLHEKFLKEPQPNVELLNRITHQHEVAASSIKAMGGSKEDARKVNIWPSMRIPSTKEMQQHGRLYPMW